MGRVAPNIAFKFHATTTACSGTLLGCLHQQFTDPRVIEST